MDARLALVLLPVALGGCRSNSLVEALPVPEAHAAGGLPRPTEHTLDEGAEARHKASRLVASTLHMHMRNVACRLRL